MEYPLYFLFVLLLIKIVFQPIEGQCTGGIWPIDDASIGSFNVSWHYNVASNTVQFIIQGTMANSIDLPSTYVAIGWSDTGSTMDNLDVAVFFPGTNIVQDRYSRGQMVPGLDNQQDFCVIRTSVIDKNIYVAFERFLTTGDSNDISFIPNLYLMFFMGLYTSNSVVFTPQQHFFRTQLQTSTSLIDCISNACSTINCKTASCPCLQQIISGVAQCTCFPPSACISGSTVTPRTTTSILAAASSTSMSNNGSCQNQVNPCPTNAICIQTTATQYICQCKNNYTGVLCQTPSGGNNNANSNTCQCVNGGTCLANGTCSCSDRYRGKYCQLNNPCSNYCRNGSTCSIACTDTSCGTPTCICANGNTGVQCQTNATGTCQSNPCVNGNCVMITNTSFQCQCYSGFLGTRCDMINSCVSNPCIQGTCVASTNCLGLLCGYSCLCPNGTTGTNCEIGGNVCSSAPCKNNGSCYSLSNSYLCACSSPYAGPSCELIINVCTPNPCFRGGTCVRSTNILDGTFRCDCPNGVVGGKCEYLNGCTSAPCRNGGQCVPSTTSCSSTTCAATCRCLPGTTGTYCEQMLVSCIQLPCLNGGKCVTNPTTNISSCQCPANTTGSRCQNSQAICTSTICSNNGACYIDTSSGINTTRCVCSQGYTGPKCQSSLNYFNSCLSNPCGLNSTCFPSFNISYYCLCSNGVIGQSCSSNTLNSCSDSPCHYLSKCQQVPNSNSSSYQCVCPDYLIGNRCQYVNNCQKQPCYNQGTCVPLGPQNNFMCLCQPGFGHYDCSTYLGLSCNSNVCLNGGTCDYNSTNIRCICPAGFTGVQCEWTLVCSTSTCLNGGTCRQIAPTMAECLCATGYTGPTCSLRDACTNFPCKNGGGCTPLLTDTGTNWSAYRCVCPSGIYGPNCDTPLSSCANMLCPSYKICSEQPTGPICTCSGNKVGTFCQYDNPCGVSASISCANGGTCVSSNTDPPVPTCLCRQGFTGAYCNLTRLDDPCASNPCQSHGYCALSPSNTSYSCICQSTYTGSQCERPNPCLSSPCLNDGVCQAYWNALNTWFTCRCVDTFGGARCETSFLNPCGGLCMNGSPCVNGVCVCPSQYIGTFCGYINPCQSSICQNGGLCSSNFTSTSASFTCTCPSPYTGQYCEISLATQLNGSCVSSCNNGGTCVDGTCLCTTQYVGPTCQYTNPCVTNNSCLNSGTCFGRYNTSGIAYTQCFCSQGYTGVNCEATICSSTSCNGGVCAATQNTFVCQCPTGKIGDRCQYTNVCVSNPCLSNQRCEQTTDSYQCVSCYDQSTYCSIYQTRNEYCNDHYSILVNNTYLSVIAACQRSCNQCQPSQNLNDISSSFVKNNDDNSVSGAEKNVIGETTTTTSGQNIIYSRNEQCFDKRADCSTQKVYGFCKVFNEQYPDECIKTCHPDCASHS